MKKFWVALILIITAISCYRPYRDDRYFPQTIAGYKAVYSADPELKKIKFITTKQMISPGKIYAKDNLILQNDIGLGVHVYDASDPSQLNKKGFINLPGNVELSIKGNYLYANSYTDLVVIDLRNLDDLIEVKRVYNAFNGLIDKPWSGSFIPMPELNAWYECIDPAKGTHIGWQKDSLSNVCYFYNY